MSEFSIEFQPVGRRGQFQSGQSVLDCGRALGVGISSVCGGKGTCGKCRVQLVSGASSPPRDGEIKAFSPLQLASGWRLACQCFPTGDCVVHVPVESMTTPQRTQLEGLDIPVRAPITGDGQVHRDAAAIAFGHHWEMRTDCSGRSGNNGCAAPRWTPTLLRTSICSECVTGRGAARPWYATASWSPSCRRRADIWDWQLTSAPPNSPVTW